MDRLYIIGNGFDIDLGMKTKYSDFLYSSEFRTLQHRSADEICRNFAGYILKEQTENWVDMESALKKYVNDYINTNGESFEQVYDTLKVKLKEFLIKQENQFLENVREVNGDYGNSNSVKLIRKIKSEVANSNKIKVINFNYTSKVFKFLFDRVDVINNQNLVEIIHVHGTLNENSGLVLGIEDSALNVGKEDFGYIIKGRDIHMANTDWFNSYSKVNEITVFGHSLGESDVMHFKPMFEHVFKERKAHNVTFNFHYKGSHNLINERIDRLVDYNIGQFRSSSKLNYNPEFLL
jgi:hypothetical protein